MRPTKLAQTSLLFGLFLLARCGSDEAAKSQPSGLDDSGTSSEKDGATQEDAGSVDVSVQQIGAANVVFVLADDLAANLVQFMPNVQAMQKEGMTFSNYFVSDSLCCPSRTSILTGKFPHNSGVFANTGAQGGYDTYLAKGNADDTFGVALKAAGYRTGFGGKVLNGYKTNGPNGGALKGYTDWFTADNGYPEFDYDLTENGTIKHYGNKATDYLTDVMRDHGTKFVEAQTGNFFLEIATFAPHSPLVPAPRHEALFPKLDAPRGPIFATKPTNATPWIAKLPDLTKAQIDSIDVRFRTRARMVQAVDEMIGDLRKSIAALPKELADNTYVVFSSDNGFHLGEHGLFAGKQTAFDTDIHVPLVVVGPGVPKGAVSDVIVQNTDLCPTFAELARTAIPPKADGHSLVDILRGQAVTDWRDAALVEHRQPVPDANDPDQEADASDPPDYSALRTKDALFVEYGGGAVEYYDLKADPDESNNAIATLSDANRKRLHDWLASLKGCKGAAECWTAGHSPP